MTTVWIGRENGEELMVGDILQVAQWVYTEGWGGGGGREMERKDSSSCGKLKK